MELGVKSPGAETRITDEFQGGILSSDRVDATDALMCELKIGRLSGETEGYVPFSEVAAYFAQKRYGI